MNLVTMHVDTGDNPPICQKPYTLPSQALTAGFNKKSKH